MPNNITPRALALAAFACSMPLLAPLAQAATPADASLLVVHGLPGRDVSADLNPLLPVDVLVDDAVCLLRGLTFGRIAGPFSLPPGTYDVKVSLASTLAPCGNAPVIEATTTLKAGENAALVAALSTAGAPILDPFAFDLTTVPLGEARVVALNAADAPPLNLVFDQTGTALRDVQPDKNKAIVLGAHGFTLSVVPGTSGQPVIGPQPLNLAPRSVVLEVAVGSLASGSLQLLTTTFPDVF